MLTKHNIVWFHKNTTKMAVLGKKKEKPAPFKPKWSKCLYVKSGLPDNYCNKSFLESKRTNGNLDSVRAAIGYRFVCFSFYD